MEHEPDLIPDLSLTSITDRSNSSSMGKALLFVQVGWFCLNSASRLGRAPAIEAFWRCRRWRMASALGVLCSVVVQAPEHR